MRVINILLVEDDHVDTLDIRRTLDKMKLNYILHNRKNGEEALSFLEEQSTDESSFPDLALVDINMPRMNGLEFLDKVRSSDKFKHLKCFIITTSEEKVDKDEAKRLGISGYIVKPLKLSNPSSMDAFNLLIDLMNMKN